MVPAVFFSSHTACLWGLSYTVFLCRVVPIIVDIKLTKPSEIDRDNMEMTAQFPINDRN